MEGVVVTWTGREVVGGAVVSLGIVVTVDTSFLGSALLFKIGVVHWGRNAGRRVSYKTISKVMGSEYGVGRLILFISRANRLRR